MKFKVFTVSALAFALVLGACSKKQVKEEGDVSADAGMMTPTDLSAQQVGSPIPELSTVYFEYDSFALTSSSKASLDGHAAWLKANPNRVVQVEGHCDERGTTEYNLALGERRATTVRDYLMGQGVPASQLSTISYGEERPATQGMDESAWSRNRRSEFVSGGR